MRRTGAIGVPLAPCGKTPSATPEPDCYQLGVSKLLRGVAAGWGAKKLGGGCLSTVIVFFVLWYLLGHFDIFR
jgi:hypothetical protein